MAKTDLNQLYKNIHLLIISIFLIGSLFMYRLLDTPNLIKGILLVVIPVLIPAILAMCRPELIECIPAVKSEILKTPNRINLVLFYVLLYILSLYAVYLNGGRTLIYFLLITLMGGVILLQIFYLNNSFLLVLFQEVALLTNLIFSYTFRHPLPIFTTDFFYHISYIKSVADLGYISEELGYYVHWPMFHVINSMGFLLTDLNMKASYFLLNGLCFAISILFIYLVTVYIYKNDALALLTTLVYIFLRPVVYTGMNMITRSYSYILCLVILYFVIKSKCDNQSNLSPQIIFLSIIFIPMYILSHQTTLVFFSIILFFIFFIDKTINRSSKTPFTYLFLMSLSFIAYWFYLCGPIIENWLETLFSTKESVYVSGQESSNSEPMIFYSILMNLDYSILLFISALGAIVYLKNLNQKSGLFGTSLIISSIIMLPLIHPSISGLLTSFLGYRWPILVSPFVAIIAAIGFQFLIMKSKSISMNAVSFILILLFFLASSTMIGYSTDFEDYQQVVPSSSPRSYLLDSELASFNYISAYIPNNVIIFSDYVFTRYINSNGYRSSDAFSGLNYTMVSSGAYLIFRDLEYRSSGVLHFSGDPEGLGLARSTEIVRQYYEINLKPHSSWLSGAKIYNSDTIYIYIFKDLILDQIAMARLAAGLGGIRKKSPASSPWWPAYATSWPSCSRSGTMRRQTSSG